MTKAKVLKTLNEAARVYNAETCDLAHPPRQLIVSIATTNVSPHERDHAFHSLVVVQLQKKTGDTLAYHLESAVAK